MTYDAITSMPAGQALSVTHQPVHAAIKANLEEVQSGLGVVSNAPSAYKYLVSRGTGSSLWVERLQWDVRDFGATIYASEAAAVSGGTSSTDAINAALAAAHAAGGGEVIIPGWVLIGASTNGQTGYTANVAIHFNSYSNVHLRGIGVGASGLALKSSAESHAVQLTGTTDCSVSHLTIDGDASNQTAGVHGINIASGATRPTFHDLRIKDCRVYGIGLQAGAIVDAHIHDVVTEDTGADGIDFKNKSNANTPSYVSRVTIIRPCRRDNSGQSGLGVRGIVHLSDITILGLDGVVAKQQGINFKEGETGDLITYPNGEGAHGSTLTNFYIEATADLADTATGVYISARDVTVSNGRVKGARYGVLAQGAGERARVTNVSADSCLDLGFYGQHEDASFVNCTAVNGTTSGGGAGGGFHASQRSNVIGCLIKDNDGPGLTFQAASSATDSKIIGNTFDGNGSTVTTNSIVALFRDNTGYVTEAWGSAVISGGTVTVSHGLAGTPQHVAPERGSGADITYSATSTELTFTGVDGTIRWYARYQP